MSEHIVAKSDSHKFGPLDNLYTDGFDAEQIWEQIHFQVI